MSGTIVADIPRRCSSPMCASGYDLCEIAGTIEPVVCGDGELFRWESLEGQMMKSRQTDHRGALAHLACNANTTTRTASPFYPCGLHEVCSHWRGRIRFYPAYTILDFPVSLNGSLSLDEWSGSPLMERCVGNKCARFASVLWRVLLETLLESCYQHTG